MVHTRGAARIVAAARRPRSVRWWPMALLLAACGGAQRAPAATVVEVPTAAATPEAPRAPPPALAAAQRVGGVFEGKLWSSGELVQAETVLQLTAPVGSGSYWMMEDEQRVPGTLTDCVAAGELRFTCEWHDQYGNGALDLILDRDLQRFEGLWSTDEAPDDKHPWLGTRLTATQAASPDAP